MSKTDPHRATAEHRAMLERVIRERGRRLISIGKGRVARIRARTATSSGAPCSSRAPTARRCLPT